MNKYVGVIFICKTNTAIIITCIANVSVHEEECHLCKVSVMQCVLKIIFIA